jgi:LPS export ABC transporter protein LptC
MVKPIWTVKIMGLALLSSAGLTGCRDESPRESDRVVPEIQLEAVQFRAYREAALAASGEAARVTYRRDNGDLAAAEVRITLPGAPGRAAALVSAPRARGNARSRDLLASGGVRLTRGADLAETEEARYEGADGLVHGDRPISIRGPGYALDGPGFVLDPRAERMDILGGARLVAERGGLR